MREILPNLSLVSIWTFFAFRCSFWFFVPTKSHNEQCDAQMETSTKNQNEQQKAITSNKRHLPVLVFEIELILSQKQERATKSSKRQRTANGNTHQKPKRATKSNKEHFSFPFSFIRTSSGPVEGGLYQEQWKARKSNDGQRKAMKSSKKLRRATKSNNGHQSWKNQNGQEKTKTSNEGHKKSKWKPGFISYKISVPSILPSLWLTIKL